LFVRLNIPRVCVDSNIMYWQGTVKKWQLDIAILVTGRGGP
jgi:hypothetical protein